MIKILRTSDGKILRTASGKILRYDVPDYTSIKYGLLYNWYAVNDSNKITSSDDWVVPTEAQWVTFENYCGYPVGNHGLQLLITATSAPDPYWTGLAGTPTNALGFNGVGGSERSETGTYGGLRTSGEYWSSTSFSTGLARFRSIYSIIYGNGVVAYKAKGKSIRLLYTGSGTPTSYTGNDGKIYRVVLIGSQYWLADNLSETKYRDGSTIPEVTDNTTWSGLILTSSGARCYYNNDSSNL